MRRHFKEKYLQESNRKRKRMKAKMYMCLIRRRNKKKGQDEEVHMIRGTMRLVSNSSDVEVNNSMKYNQTLR